MKTAFVSGLRTLSCILGLTLSASSGFAQVSVTATAGDLGPTAYATVKAAFDAINAGTPQGAITIDIGANTAEGATPAVLNSNGAGSALYTSVLIRPSADGVTVAGSPPTGRGVIELNGADNVTIDGDNPGSGGINRNLTIQNTVAATTTYGSVIRIALATTVVTSADNNTLKNLNLLGHATGRNIAGATSTTGTENASYGILATGGASTVSATTAPTAISSVSTVIGAGATATNLTIQNNSITTAARAVAVQGSATTVFPGLLIENNVIGNATAGATDQVYSMGVTVQGSTNAIVRGNTVYLESFLGTQVRGLEFGSISATGTGATFEKNQVLRVRNNNGATFGAYGINLGGGSTHTVQNNFVADVRNDQTAGSGAFSTTFGAFGIRVGSGTGHKVYHNSVNMSGVLPGAVSTDLTAALCIVATTQTGCDVRNNIFSNTITGGNPTAASTRHAAIFLPSAGTSAMALTLNNNAYYQGPSTTGALSLMAQVGTTGGTGQYLAADFNPGATSPANNLRAYTSILSVAGTNDSSSMGSSAVAPFTSAANLHIPAATVTELESKGAAVGLAIDIDNDARPGPAGSVNGGATAPDLGADEFDGTPGESTPPAITYSPLGPTASTGARTLNANITDASGVPTVGAGLPVLYWKVNAGSYTAATGSHLGGSQYQFSFGSGVSLGDVVSYYIVAQDGFATPNVGSSPSAGAGGFTANPPAAATPPTTPNSYNVAAITGTKTVGAGGDYADLASAINALNNAEITRPVVFSLTDAAYSVPGTGLTINANPGSSSTNTVTFKPTGVSTISGSVNGALIKFNGASYMTIDGSNTVGGTTRDLTITNTSVTGPIVVWFGSVGTTPIAGDTLMNCVVINGVNTNSALVISDGGVAGGPGFFSNMTIENNSVQKAYIGVYANGGTTPQGGSGLVYRKNDLTTSGANAVRYTGLYMQGVNGATVSKNTLANFSGTEAEDDRGVWLASGTINATVDSNTMHTLKYTGTGGYGQYGVAVSTGATGANVTVSNNMIYNLSGDGWNYTSILGDNTIGIYAFGTQTGVKIHFNSINFSGNTLNQTSAMSAGIALGTGTTADVSNNAIVNNLGLSAALGYGSTGIFLQTGASQLVSANYNDYVVNPTGTGVKAIGQIATTASGTLAAWQAATGQEANSLNVDPMFVSATDLHLQAGSPMLGAGVAVAGITVDFDGDTRDTPPDIGGDEIVAAPVCLGNTNGDGFVDVLDLLAVINAWGPCTAPCPPTPCPADVAQPSNCVVDVVDLLSVINHWGTCP